MNIFAVIMIKCKTLQNRFHHQFRLSTNIAQEALSGQDMIIWVNPWGILQRDGAER